LFNRKNKIEVIETDTVGEKVYATNKTVVIAALIPLAVAITPILINHFTKDTYTPTTIPVSTPSIVSTIPPPVQIPSMPVTQTIEQITPVIAQNTGVVADTSAAMLATVLDPLINLMVAVSFPIASVIILGGCFFFMIGNSEKAWDTIFKAALGFVLIQLSPLFLDILRNVGEAVV
jgi:hypothetical protein